MSKIWDIPSPYKSGAKKHLFGRLRNLRQLSRLYLRNETRYRQSVKSVDNYKGFPIWFQNIINFGLQTALNWTAIFTHLCKFCFLRHCQASQTEISKQNSTKLCQMADGKSRKQSAVEQLGSSVVPQKKWGPRNVTFVRFFYDFHT